MPAKLESCRCFRTTTAATQTASARPSWDVCGRALSRKGFCRVEGLGLWGLRLSGCGFMVCRDSREIDSAQLSPNLKPKIVIQKLPPRS